MIAPAVTRARHGAGIAGVTVLVGGLALAYVPVARALVTLWHTNPYYSYGVIIPFFAAYVVWDSRRALAGAPAWWVPGLAFAVIGLGILAIGSALDSLALRTLSLPLALAGLGLFTLGRERFRAFAMPVAFLALMAPLPAAAIPALSVPLQDAAAFSTELALRAVGIPVARDGLYVHMPDVTIWVSEACNGLRFLLAMTIVGIAFAWLTQRGIARRVGVLVAAIVIAIVANWLRVAGTALIAHAYGVAAASGAPHIVYGKIVYGAMLVPFLLVVLWMRGSDR